MRVLVVVGAALALASSALAATPTVKARLITSTPTPVVDETWRWTVVVKDGKGRPLAAKMKLQILFGTLVVGCWKGTAIAQCSGSNPGTWILFKGKRAGALTWPALSIGQKLTFQARVTSGGKTILLRAPVTVRPKA